MKRKIYNNGFYDYYYKCQECGCESISLKHKGGFQPADLICDKCSCIVVNNKTQIEDFSDKEIIQSAVEKKEPILYTEEEVYELFNSFRKDFSLYRGIQIMDVQLKDWFEQYKKHN